VGAPLMCAAKIAWWQRAYRRRFLLTGVAIVIKVWVGYNPQLALAKGGVPWPYRPGA